LPQRINIQSEVKVDYSMFERRMGALANRVIPRAMATVEQIALYGLRAVKIFTLRGGHRTPGRRKIADLWEMRQSRKNLMQIYTIRNLYPEQEVVLFFEKGTTAHQIVPNRSKVLVFETSQGEKVFTKEAYHPGTRATKMVERTEEIIRPRIDIWKRQTLALADRELK